MNDISRTAEREERGGDLSSRVFPLRVRGLAEALGAALEQERALRRPFLWLVVASGGGVVLYFSAEREPSLALCLCALAAFAVLAALTRRHARAHAFFLTLAFIALGFASGAWRTARVAAPIVPRVGIGQLTGFVEEVDRKRHEDTLGPAAPAEVTLFSGICSASRTGAWLLRRPGCHATHFE